MLIKKHVYPLTAAGREAARVYQTGLQNIVVQIYFAGLKLS